LKTTWKEPVSEMLKVKLNGRVEWISPFKWHSSCLSVAGRRVEREIFPEWKPFHRKTPEWIT
jgi:hypothetical protein